MRDKGGEWVQLMRPFSFTASIVPVALGSALSFSSGRSVAWLLLPCTFLSAVTLLAATNVASEYFDLKKGVDTKDSYGSSRVLVEGGISPEEALRFSAALFGLAIVCALPLVAVRGLPLFWLLALAVLTGFFYSGYPLGYKYAGLGDAGVFVLMGPLMVAGTFFTLTGGFEPYAVHASIPVACLVTAILAANNLRDIRHDRQARVRTLENTIGFRAGKVLNLGYIVAAYVSVAVMASLRVLPVWSWAVFLTVPLAAKNIRGILSAREDAPQDLASADVANAQLHLAFGTILVLAVFAGGLLR